MDLRISCKAEQGESKKLNDPRKVVRLRIGFVPSHLVGALPDVEVESTQYPDPDQQVAESDGSVIDSCWPHDL